MALTYRTAGDWGPGKGANLTPAEVDENFNDLDSRVTDLEENPVQGVSVVGFTVDLWEFRVHMSDGSVFGPFELPNAMPVWADPSEWTPGITYPPLNMFTVAGVGVFMTLREYTAPTEFDPDEESTEGPYLRKVFGLAPPSIVTVTTYTASHELTPEDMGGYIRMDSVSGVLLSIPDHADVPFDVGAVVTIRQSGTGQVAIDPLSSDIVINTPETLLLRRPGSTATLINVGPNEWDLAGDLEQA